MTELHEHEPRADEQDAQCDERGEQLAAQRGQDVGPIAPRAQKPARVASDAKNRLKRRNGRFYLDLRDLGLGREALIPAGATYATKDADVAMDLAGKRIAAVLRPERERYFGRSTLTRTVSVGELARRQSPALLDRTAGCESFPAV